tara:strand:- start:1212 stop:1796 length:585 start_codon:yes stop_codon:yes gene_type:complete
MPDDNGVITISEYKREIIRCVSELDNDVLGVVKDKLQGTHTYEDDGAKLLTFIDRVFIVGNGGSHAIAEHISTDLNKRCKVKAYTLSNNSLQTALTNDYSQEDALTQWLKISELKKRDCVIAVSSSGKSPNIIRALQYAGEVGSHTLSIFGMDGQPVLSGNRDHFVKIDSYNYGVVELTSEIALHAIVEELVVE